MKTAIIFREGLSGNYLRSLIEDSQEPMGFRVDPWYPGIYDALGQWNQIWSKRPSIIDPDKICDCFHIHRILDLTEIHSQYDLILNIQVYTKIYHAIYNNFHKKFLIENPELASGLSHWQEDMSFWYDTVYYNIKEYYTLFRQDAMNTQFENLINFDHMLNIDYIQQILKTYYDRDINHNTVRIVSDYARHQLQYHVSRQDTNMEDIVSDIPDHEFQSSPWFAMYCISKFEINNGLDESHRIWSIDDLDRAIDKSALLEIAKTYQR